MSDVSAPFGGDWPSRFLALAFPRLPTDRIRRARLGRSWLSGAHPDGARPTPLALFESIRGANRLVAVCEAAAESGLRPGTGLAEARARFPDFAFEPADAQADLALLEKIADWCDRYTPLVALDAPSGAFAGGLIFDITGCAHLFGGEAALFADLSRRLEDQGLWATAAIAAEAGTAQALATHRPATVAQRGEEEQLLSPLSLSALRLETTLNAALGRLGLATIGDLAAQPRPALARRFGQDLLVRLDRAHGRLRHPIGPRLAVPALIAERRLFEPISLSEDIERVALILAGRLRSDLERRGEGARRLALSLFRVDGHAERLEVACSSPLRDPQRIVALFRERLKAVGDEREAGFGYDLVRLSVLLAAPIAPAQTDLSGEDPGRNALGDLVDRLEARLGPASVLRLEPVESHWPERAERPVPMVGLDSGPVHGARSAPARSAAASGVKARALVAAPPLVAPRPLRLLPSPEPIDVTAPVPDGLPGQFRWRRALYRIRRIEGPERITPEWWEDEVSRLRDYFRVEDEAGRRFWLFREGTWEDAALLAGDLGGADLGAIWPVDAASRELVGLHEPAADWLGPDEMSPVPAPRPPAWFLHGLFA